MVAEIARETKDLCRVQFSLLGSQAWGGEGWTAKAMTWRDWLGLAKWAVLTYACFVAFGLVVLAIIANLKERRAGHVWHNEVVRICKEREYAEWFYADREAWLEDYRDGMTPEEAVEYQLECAL